MPKCEWNSLWCNNISVKPYRVWYISTLRTLVYQGNRVFMCTFCTKSAMDIGAKIHPLHPKEGIYSKKIDQLKKDLKI